MQGAATGGVAESVRRAGIADVARLVELRRVMLEVMGEPVTEDRSWEQACAQYLHEQLSRPQRFAVFVVDAPAAARRATAVACAAGVLEHRAPSPSNPAGVTGRLFNVATDPRHRRRGHARATVRAVLEWFDTATPATTVSLVATPDGTPLYRALGFAPPDFPQLQRHRPHDPG